jgi:hypothetical protein
MAIETYKKSPEDGLGLLLEEYSREIRSLQEAKLQSVKK